MCTNCIHQNTDSIKSIINVSSSEINQTRRAV